MVLGIVYVCKAIPFRVGRHTRLRDIISWLLFPECCELSKITEGQVKDVVTGSKSIMRVRTMSTTVLFCLETLPRNTGTWEYEEDVATFQGDVDCVLRHPNPRSSLRPRRMRIPMVYIMHIPPAYTLGDSTSPMRPGRYDPNGYRRFSPPSSRDRVVREYDSVPSRRPRTRSPPRYTPGSRYVLTDEEEEEDPVEGSTGSAWMMD